MITRSNLAEQLREYQIRSKYDTSSFFFFLSPSSSSSPNSIFSRDLKSKCRSYWDAGLCSWFLLCLLVYVLGVSGFAILLILLVVMSSSLGRVDVVIFVIWELVILAFLVFAAISLYFRHMKLAFILVCVTLLLFVCMKIAKQVRLARKKKRRMLLPLSM